MKISTMKILSSLLFYTSWTLQVHAIRSPCPQGVTGQPIAVADSFTTDQNSPYDNDYDFLLLNDRHNCGQRLYVLSVEALAETKGSVVWDSQSATFTYTPLTGFCGTDVFKYTIEDDENNEAMGTVTATVNNCAPTANDDTFTTPQNQAISASVLSNDFDSDGGILAVVSVNGNPASVDTSITFDGAGELTLASSGSFQFDPVIGFCGTVTFTYEVSNGSSTSTATVTILTVDECAILTSSVRANEIWLFVANNILNTVQNRLQRRLTRTEQCVHRPLAHLRSRQARLTSRSEQSYCNQDRISQRRVRRTDQRKMHHNPDDHQCTDRR